jgi:hypothetical protein
MSEYYFGVTHTKISDRKAKAYDRIAREVGGAGCGFVSGIFPGDGWKGWFFAPNLGAPFDGQTERDVLAAIEAEFPTPSRITYDVRAPGHTAWSTHTSEAAARRELAKVRRAGSLASMNLRIFRHDSHGPSVDVTDAE